MQSDKALNINRAGGTGASSIIQNSDGPGVLCSWWGAAGPRSNNSYTVLLFLPAADV